MRFIVSSGSLLETDPLGSSAPSCTHLPRRPCYIFRGMVAFQLSDKKEASRNPTCCSSSHLALCLKLILLTPLLLHVVHAQDEVHHPISFLETVNCRSTEFKIQ